VIAGSKTRWRNLSLRRRILIIAGILIVVVVVVTTAVVLNIVNDDNGLSLIDPLRPTRTYGAVFLLVFLDAVIPIFPGETTLNAAATAAAHGMLDLWPIIAMGALGAILGDSTLF
jgi:uncharacterized membrane protein YdjX (TVP38/TMEM64 family)